MEHFPLYLCPSSPALSLDLGISTHLAMAPNVKSVTEIYAVVFGTAMSSPLLFLGI